MSPQLLVILLKFADEQDIIGYSCEDTAFQEVEEEYKQLLKQYLIG